VAVDAPTIDEIRSAVKKLKLGRAAGGDAIAPEMLKLAIEPTSSILHKTFAQVWLSGKVPSAWKEGIIVSLYKGKGPRDEYSSNQRLTPLIGWPYGNLCVVSVFLNFFSAS